jgi:hypothetical protein
MLWWDTNVSEVLAASTFRIKYHQSLHPEGGSSKYLRNISILPQYYTVSQPRRPRLESSPPWKPQISQYVSTCNCSRNILYHEVYLAPQNVCYRVCVCVFLKEHYAANDLVSSVSRQPTCSLMTNWTGTVDLTSSSLMVNTMTSWVFSDIVAEALPVYYPWACFSIALITAFFMHVLLHHSVCTRHRDIGVATSKLGIYTACHDYAWRFDFVF